MEAAEAAKEVGEGGGWRPIDAKYAMALRKSCEGDKQGGRRVERGLGSVERTWLGRGFN